MTTKPKVSTKSTGAAAEPLNAKELNLINAWWRACNYLSVGMIYLRDNPLLKEPLKIEHVKHRLLGHWGLPDIGIVVVHRSDGSGTTFIFSDYLNKVSKEWEFKVGADKSLNWPVGLGAKGNPDVAGLVNQTPGAIGYVELIYTIQNNMPAGLVKNKAGNFIEPSLTSVSAAANIEMPDDTRVSLTNTDAAEGYPISGFTWLVFYKEQNYAERSKEKAEELLKLLWWVVREGQQFAEPLHYSPIAQKAVEKAEKILLTLTYDHVPLLKK